MVLRSPVGSSVGFAEELGFGGPPNFVGVGKLENGESALAGGVLVVVGGFRFS